MRRGILGGTFDPVHLGHIILAQETLVRLALDEVWFIPTGLPWMKRDEALTPGHHRCAMVERAIEGNPQFRCSRLEIDRPGETFTVDTLEELVTGEMAGDELFFIMGLDALGGLHRWKAPARILELATVVVALRPGYGALDLRELETVVPGAAGRVIAAQMPLIEISGTELRRRATEGGSMRYLVPDAVAEYIHRQGLYRRPD